MQKANQKHTQLMVTLPAEDVAALIGAGEIAATTAPGTEVNRLAAERFLQHRKAVAAQLARQTAYQPVAAAPLPSQGPEAFLSRFLSHLFRGMRHA